MSTAPIAVAFVGAVVVFAAWTLAMTHERWSPDVEPALRAVRQTIAHGRAVIARELVSMARAPDAQNSWWPSR